MSSRALTPFYDYCTANRPLPFHLLPFVKELKEEERESASE